jgi:NAD(P)H-quinone oxidoreductase subunit 3
LPRFYKLTSILPVRMRQVAKASIISSHRDADKSPVDSEKEKKPKVFVLKGYEYFLGFLLACSLVPILSLTASKVLRPSGGGPERRTTYESGMEPIGGAWIQFNIRYYMFALVFVVFDVETVFLYPWAVAFNQLGVLAFVEALIFIAILVVALVYAWRKGALEWS